MPTFIGLALLLIVLLGLTIRSAHAQGLERDAISRVAHKRLLASSLALGIQVSDALKAQRLESDGVLPVRTAKRVGISEDPVWWILFDGEAFGQYGILIILSILDHLLDKPPTVLVT
ncbi:hypothetical protein EON81_05580 [bacterium]|nr:MAG: hypothetical protein EON81_05580 [bacterium]